MDKIKELLRSNIKEDLLMGIFLLSKENPSYDSFREVLRENIIYRGHLDIYIGKYNICIYDNIAPSVYSSKIKEDFYAEKIRL